MVVVVNVLIFMIVCEVDLVLLILVGLEIGVVFIKVFMV